MAMAVDSRHHSIGGLGYDHLRYHSPHFSNPWVSSSPPAPSTQLYPAASLASSMASSLDTVAHHHHQNQSHQQQSQHQHSVSSQPAPVNIPYTANLSVSAPTLTTSIQTSEGGYETMNLLDASQDVISPARSYGANTPTYASANSTTATPIPTVTTTAPSANYLHASTPPNQYSLDFSPSGRSPYNYNQSEAARRSSHPVLGASQRDHFSDALDASRGMIAMSQELTNRTMYAGHLTGRHSLDAYTSYPHHSSHSSISSSSTFPSYYNDSTANSSVTDYSSASEVDQQLPSRTLPRPPALIGNGMPPAPQSMMGQFSSKVSSSSQKKHKCKICDKRFTRPSSLQTHMYSHTGEKPFACEVPGCGRHFSVVSNLRRHRKVHRTERGGGGCSSE